jgi:DNA replication protein DnaC
VFILSATIQISLLDCINAGLQKKSHSLKEHHDGLVKSHVATGLAHAACIQGFTVLFVNAHRMLQHLNGGRADNTFERRLTAYLRPDLLVIDDFGLKPLAAPGPHDLYDVIAERYEQGSILLTSNRAPSEWPDLFADPLLASAGLDRLLHHAQIITITGRSFRAQASLTSPELETLAIS